MTEEAALKQAEATKNFLEDIANALRLSFQKLDSVGKLFDCPYRPFEQQPIYNVWQRVQEVIAEIAELIEINSQLHAENKKLKKELEEAKK